jgi:hypothetical protein
MKIIKIEECKECPYESFMNCEKRFIPVTRNPLLMVCGMIARWKMHRTRKNVIMSGNLAMLSSVLRL